MSRVGDSLLKVGVILMALALALVIVGVVVSVTLGTEPGRVAAEVASKSVGEPPGYSSGEQESSLGYGSSSPSGEPIGQRREDAKEPQALAAASEPSKSRSEMPRPGGQQTPSESELRPQQHQTQAREQVLPAAEDTDWPEPTQEELQSANAPRHYNLPAGAIMGLTIPSIGIYNAPVFDSDSQWALANGVAHVPETSLPWSPTAQRNVYLAGHRMGFRGTWSRLIFYNLDELREGEKVVLEDRTGRIYEYRVSETLLADPADSWVMGQVRGRDLLTLQTCTPIPTFEKRLIIRADRV